MKLSNISIVTLLLVAAFFFAAGWYSASFHLRHGGHSLRQVQARGYRFTSPLLDVELPEGLTVNMEPVPFKHKVEELIGSRTDGVVIRKVAVYYRDLLDGPWFGINDAETFNPASMMKVPVMIAWLKRAEKSPHALAATFAYAGDEDMTAYQVHKPRQTLQKGKRYAVSDLLVFMMKYSDNNAAKLLYENLSPEELGRVLDGMDVENRPRDGHNSVTVHGYSGFFRMLYNASFLNREMSEKALQLLTEEDFSEGIVAGVPPGTVVAAKFGEMEEGANRQLHEFGIVYSPKGHYILGVMTEGSNSARQAEVIRDISAVVYASANSSRPINDK